MEITLSTLRQILGNINTPTKVEILAMTDTRARRNPFGTIYKQSRILGTIGGNYGNRVNNRGGLLARLFRPFKSAPRSWGEYTKGVLINDNYLPVIVSKSLFPRFMTASTSIFEGAGMTFELKESEVKHYLPASYFSQRQSDFGLLQPQQVVAVNYALTSIQKIVIGGHRFEIVGE